MRICIHDSAKTWHMADHKSFIIHQLNPCILFSDRNYKLHFMYIYRFTFVCTIGFLTMYSEKVVVCAAVQNEMN